MSIGIGINKNVVISATGFDDKDRLFIELKQLSEDKKETSPFDESLTAGVTSDGKNSMKLNFLKFLVPKEETRDGKQRTRSERVDLIASDIKNYKNQLTQILEQFMLLENIDLTKVDIQYANTGITDSASYSDRILSQDALDRIYKNMSTRFVELIQPHLNAVDTLLRFKLIRQGKDKNFAKIPDRFISDRPFVDLMTVPDNATRVKFSDYEIREGLNSAEPVGQSTAEPKESPAVLESNPFAPQT